jgi:hypothetical protein
MARPRVAFSSGVGVRLTILASAPSISTPEVSNMQVHVVAPATAGEIGAAGWRRRRAALTAARAAAMLGMLALVGARPGVPAVGVPSIRPAACAAGALRPPLYSIPLLPDQGMAGSGVATLVPAPSPFGITVTADGHPVFDVTVTVQNLAPPKALGGAQYVAWATTQDLTDADKIGVIGADQKAVGRVAWNKYIVLVTVEPSPVPAHWTGAVILRGFSPATYLANYASHPLFLGGMPPC